MRDSRPTASGSGGRRLSLAWDVGRLDQRSLPTPYQLPRCLKLDLFYLGNPLRCVEYLYGDKVTVLVVIEDDPGLVLVALNY